MHMSIKLQSCPKFGPDFDVFGSWNANFLKGGPNFLPNLLIRVTIEHVSKFSDDRPSDLVGLGAEKKEKKENNDISGAE